jgi:DNA-binding NarL/FixJ family response regulator
MKLKCLIIDDHHLFNDGLVLILKESGKFEVMEQIYDSRQAYSKCTQHTADLILVDYNMPHLNGLEVVKQLKTLNYSPKIVVISMYADHREIEQFETLGVNGYFSKTTPANLLVSQLIQILKGENYFDYHKNENKPTDNFYNKNQLTKREVEVLRLLKREYTTEQIANQMGLSYYTIETHRKNINQKMKFGSKKEFYDFLENFIS